MGWRRQDLVIANGQTRSDVLNLSENRSIKAVDLTIWAPAGLSETVTVYAAPDYKADASDASYVPYTVGGSNVTLIAGKSITLTNLLAGAVILVAGSAVGAARVLPVRGRARSA